MSSYRLRPVDRADAEAIVGIVCALDAALLGSSDYSLAELEDEWRELDLAHDAFVVVEGEDVVGYGTVEVRGELGRSDGYVHPDRFGCGVGSFLVQELERELRRRGVARVQNATLLVDERAHTLLRGHGYDDVRQYCHMRIELTEEPAAPAWPEGVTVTPFDVADAAVFHRAYEEAFADHWQHEEEPLAKWLAAYVERDDFSPELWTVVRDRDDIVAGTICIPDRLGAAWISRLFTRRDRRRQGLGEALMRDAFGKFWRAGKRTVGLGVDAQNVTGAIRLYERVGMHVHWGAVVFEKDVGAAAA